MGNAANKKSKRVDVSGAFLAAFIGDFLAAKGQVGMFAVRELTNHGHVSSDLDNLSPPLPPPSSPFLPLPLSLLFP